MDKNIKKYIHDNINNYMEHAKHIQRPIIGRCVVLPYINEGENMSIKIHVDKIKKYKLTGVEILKMAELPREYFRGYPNVCRDLMSDCFTLRYKDSKNDTVHLVSANMGDEFTEHELRLLINWIRLAGDRLHKNDKTETKEENKPAKDWSGTYTFEV